MKLNLSFKIWLTIGLLAVLVLLPTVLDAYRVQIFGKYLCFAIAAVSLNLIWGYTGIMSLGHALFFGLGAYVMGYYLKLQSPEIPEFMAMNNIQAIPDWLAPLASPWIALPMVMILPAVVALLIGWPTFKSGIKGVYFTILSQALALAFFLLFNNQQAYTGGTSGIYKFNGFFGLKISSDPMVYGTYYLALIFLVGSIVLVWALMKTRSGRIMVAIREGENRLKYLGYDPVNFKLLSFCLSAAMAGLAGGLFTVLVGSVYPTYMNIQQSVMMSIWVVAGGLGTLVGPAIGAIVLNFVGTFFTEQLPDAWWFVLGALLITLVFAFPQGFTGLYEQAAAWVKSIIRPKAAPPSTGDGGAS